MTPCIEKIMSQVYELEGLLHVIENHKGETSPYVYQLIHEKAEAINSLAQELTPDAFETVAAPAAPVAETTTPEKEECEEPAPIAESEAEHVEDDVEKPQYELMGLDSCGDECDTDLYYPEEHQAPTQEPEAEESATEETTETPEPIEEEEVETPQEIEEPTEEDEEEDDESAPDYEEIYEEEEDDDSNNDDNQQLTVDEALQRSISKNLSKAFSINDRFRYKRELFGNSDVAMKDAINTVEAMKSYSEAEDYFYGELEWDKDSPEVSDFMDIIQKHFQ